MVLFVFKRHSLVALFVLVILASCSKEQPEKIAAVLDRSKMPQLRATDITTVISDSGVTRYRIATPCWDIYDRAAQPYWEFVKGIHFEQFDDKLKVESNIQSDYARFNVNEQLWELKGNVRMTNIQGQLFETSHMFWDQRRAVFYSDTLTTITGPSGIFKWVGFEADQNMNWYRLRRSKAKIPVKNSEL